MTLHATRVENRAAAWPAPTASVRRLDDGRWLDPADATGRVWTASPTPLRWPPHRAESWPAPTPTHPGQATHCWSWSWPTPPASWPDGLGVSIVVHGPAEWGLQAIDWATEQVWQVAAAPIPGASTTCGAPTLAGGRCSRVVAAVGLRCYQHRGAAS